MLIKDPALSPYVIKYDFNGFSVGEEDSPKHREYQRTEGLQGSIQYIVSKKLAAIDRTVTLSEFREIEENMRNEITKAIDIKPQIVVDKETASSLTIND